MKKLLSFVSIAIFSASAMCAQNPQSRLSFQFQNGFEYMPGAALCLGAGIQKCPPYLSGAMIAPTVGLRLTKSSSLNFGFLRSTLAGYGNWQEASNAQEQSNGVTGMATGTTNMRTTGLTATYQRTVLTGLFRKWRVKPFVEAGGGVGFLKVNFHGTFNGMEEGFPFTQPNVTDKVTRTIPLMIAGGGFTRNMGAGQLVAGYDWRNLGSSLYLGYKMYPLDTIKKMLGK
jgi:hypothetical protein